MTKSRGADARTIGAAKPPGPWLETLRLALREFTPADVDDLHRLDRDPRVLRFLRASNPRRARRRNPPYDASSRYYRLYPDLGAWYATRRDTGRFIGWFALKYAGKSPDIEIGYRLLPDAWGRGFATEGAKALLDFGFGDLGLHRIIGVTDRDNHASQRVLANVGLADRGWGRYYDMRSAAFRRRQSAARMTRHSRVGGYRDGRADAGPGASRLNRNDADLANTAARAAQFHARRRRRSSCDGR